MRGSQVPGRDGLCFEAFVEECLEFERQRNLSRRALAEVKRYLGDLSRYAGEIDLAGPAELTPEVLQAFVQERGWASATACSMACSTPWGFGWARPSAWTWVT